MFAIASQELQERAQGYARVGAVAEDVVRVVENGS
jgi:hypothetical protein